MTPFSFKPTIGKMLAAGFALLLVGWSVAHDRNPGPGSAIDSLADERNADGANAPQSVFDLMDSWDGHIRIGGDLYRPGDSIYVHDTLEVSIWLDHDQPVHVNTDDLHKVERQALSLIGTKPPFRPAATQLAHSISGETGKLTNVLSFTIPKIEQDYTLHFNKTDSRRSYDYYVKYVPRPFAYTFSSPMADLMPYIVHRPTAYDLPLLMEFGKPYRFRIDFTMDVERSSVDEALKKALAETDWSVDWLSDRSLVLELALTEDGYRIREQWAIGPFDFIRTKTGVPVNRLLSGSAPYLLVQPAFPSSYETASFSWPNRKQQFVSLRNYTLLQAVPGTDWLLGEQQFPAQGWTRHHYHLLDPSGRIIRSFDAEFTRFIDVMISDGGSKLLFLQNGSELISYDAATSLQRTVWKASGQERIVDADYDPVSGRIMITTTTGSHEEPSRATLHLLESWQDNKPRTISLPEAALYSFFSPATVSFMDDSLYSFSLSPQDSNPPVHRMIDWGSLEMREIRLPQSVYLSIPISSTELLAFSAGEAFVFHIDTEQSTVLRNASRLQENIEPRLYKLNDRYYIANDYLDNAYTIDLQSMTIQAVEDGGKAIGTLGNQIIFRTR